KYIKTKLTTAVNSAEKDLHPFNKFAPYYNFFTGLSFFPNDCINIKLNAASGVRIPNLAELSSNGLHEGIFTYEIGDPALKNEQNFTGNLLLSFDKDDWKFSITPFYNYIRNYVFLSPTEEEWFGFPVFRFLQQDAIQYGLESEAECHPFKFLHAAISYSEMVSKTHYDHYTPYIPAPKMTPSIDLECPLNGKTIIDLHLELKHAFKQDLVAPLEMETPSYDLFDVSVSTSWLANHTEYELSLVGNNLLDEDYFDHLSRLKNFGLLNMGRNFTVNLKIKNTN
ncbi:MAG: TonB-dependent receptor, partial [Saprospiraceae bacterium]|nr:TonB-dependent receptor [Saprospiraceae bacterium]